MANQYHPDPYYRGTPRQTAGSYFNAVFGITMYGFMAKLAWSAGPEYIGFLSKIVSVIFGFMCFLQVFGLITECMGINDVQNPWTGEWTTTPTGGDPQNLRYIRPD